MAVEKAYDLTFLNKISGGDEIFIQDMITTFRGMAFEYINKSNEYYCNNLIDALSKETHRFIPGVSFLGAKNLEEDLLLIEEYTKKGENLDQIEALLGNVKVKIGILLADFDSDFK